VQPKKIKKIRRCLVALMVHKASWNPAWENQKFQKAG
jgi:transcription elongation factor GreA-like protein